MITFLNMKKNNRSRMRCKELIIILLELMYCYQLVEFQNSKTLIEIFYKVPKGKEPSNKN